MSRTRRLLGLGAVVALAASGIAAAETMPGHLGAGSSDMQAMIQHHAGMNSTAAAGPALPGQAAFGAVQEIVRMLEADPDTDWSKVNLSALREHLGDMDAVTLRASAAETPSDGGLKMAVTGGGGTLQAIQRMVPSHVQELDGLHGRQTRAAFLPDSTPPLRTPLPWQRLVVALEPSRQ